MTKSSGPLTSCRVDGGWAAPFSYWRPSHRAEMGVHFLHLPRNDKSATTMTATDDSRVQQFIATRGRGAGRPTKRCATRWSQPAASLRQHPAAAEALRRRQYHTPPEQAPPSSRQSSVAPQRKGKRTAECARSVAA